VKLGALPDLASIRLAAAISALSLATMLKKLLFFLYGFKYYTFWAIK